MTDFSLTIGASDWIEGARQVVSPNWDERPHGEIIRLIVIHSISLPPGEFGGNAIEQLFTNCLDPAEHPYFGDVHRLRVSSHFLIRRDGELLQFVAMDKRAWHAGVSCWHGRERCNDFSLGIELEGDGIQAFAEPQYECLERLLQRLLQHHQIEAVVGHSDIAPGRKSDPGPSFEWQRLAAFRNYVSDDVASMQRD